MSLLLMSVLSQFLIDLATIIAGRLRRLRQSVCRIVLFPRRGCMPFDGGLHDP